MTTKLSQPDNTDALQMAAPILAPVSIGELIDKITILEIKAQKVSDAEKLAAVAKELGFLNALDLGVVARSAAVAELKRELKRVNEALWQIEDDLRACERVADFGARFIALARSVYQTNDLRAALKRQVNELCGSALTEVKVHPTY